MQGALPHLGPVGRGAGQGRKRDGRWAPEKAKVGALQSGGKGAHRGARELASLEPVALPAEGPGQEGHPRAGGRQSPGSARTAEGMSSQPPADPLTGEPPAWRPRGRPLSRGPGGEQGAVQAGAPPLEGCSAVAIPKFLVLEQGSRVFTSQQRPQTAELVLRWTATGVREAGAEKRFRPSAGSA